MFLTRQQVRALDRRAIAEFGMTGAVLMENAGRGAADVLMRLGVHGGVVICCGKGNNGGDGFVIARHLDNQRVPTRLLLFADPAELVGEAAANYQIAVKSGLTIDSHRGPTIPRDEIRQVLASAEWVVDALFGTGLSGPVRAPFDQVIDAVNACPAKILAVDIPSGLDCDRGEPLGPTIKAHHTVTFVAPKRGFIHPAALDSLGRVHVVDIGAPRKLVDEILSSIP